MSSRTTSFFLDPAPPRRIEVVGFLNVWIPVVMLAATATALTTSYAAAVGSALVPGLSWIEWIATAVFLVDLFVSAKVDRDVRGPVRPLLRTADFLAMLPLYALTGFVPLLVFRLLKLFRIAFWMSIWRQQHFALWNALRLIYFIYWLSLAVHALTSGWLLLRHAPASVDEAQTMYLHSLYWCISTLTTIGYGDITPQTNGEIIYAMVIMIFGVGMYGYVIANISTIITNLQPSRVRYLETMERLGAFMRYQRLPGELQKRIRDYYTYVWEQRMGYDESSILRDLPPGLHGEVSLFLKRGIIRKVPFFREADDDLVRDIAMQMHPVVYTPGDVIVREGDPGSRMYFISRGRLEVRSVDGSIHADLRDGEFFGEMALIYHQPRNATVRAASYCDLYFLDQEGFNQVVRIHPAFEEHIRTMTEERRKS